MRLALSAWRYLWSVVLAAGTFPALWLLAWRGPLPTAYGVMALLVALAVAAQHFPLPLTPHYKPDVSAAVYFAMLLLFGAPAAMILVGLSQLLAGSSLSLRRASSGKRMRTIRSVPFNAAQAVLAVGLGGLVCYSLLPHLLPAPLARVENLWTIPRISAHERCAPSQDGFCIWA